MALNFMGSVITNKEMQNTTFNYFKVFLKILYWKWMFIFTEFLKKKVETHMKFCLGKADLLEFFN